MNKYEVFVPEGGSRPCIRTLGRGARTYFAGYNFMGGAEWSLDITEAVTFDTLEYALQSVSDLESADATTRPAPDRVVRGDRVTALGLTFTVERVLYHDYFGSRANVSPASDCWGFDVEFIDTRGAYHHWKQNQDGGQAARWNGRAWIPYNVDGYPVKEMLS